LAGSTDDPTLFDSAFLAKLEQLYLLSRKIFRGQHRAERRSRQIGSSLEFADYRNYVAGDDLRSIDWNIYGRLERLFLKLFEEEQDLHIYLLIDASASMRWRPESAAGEAPAGLTKFDQARRLAASLAYIGLANLDRVNVYFFGETLGEDLGVTRGKSQFHKALEFLKRGSESVGPTRLLPSFKQFAQQVKRRGLVFVLGDLFDPGYEEALALLRYNQFSVHLIQVLDPAELNPDLLGDLRLVDAETQEPFEVTSDRSLLERYRSALDGFLSGIESFSRKREIGYAMALTTVPFEDLILRVLRDGRLLR
jgi:uncharacterized protein (DUF58 family)